MRSSERTKYVPIIFVTAINKEKNHVFKRVEKELHKLLEELRHSTTQLMQAEKMSGVGTLVASVAHELNNP